MKLERLDVFGLIVRSPFRAKHHVVVQYVNVAEMSPAPSP